MTPCHGKLAAHDVIRADLVAAARGRIAAARRRRHVAVAVLAVLALLGTTTAGARLGDYTTGVPVIDRYLAGDDGGDPAPDGGGSVPPPRPYAQIGPGVPSKPFDVPWPTTQDRDKAVAVAYVSRSGMRCLALAYPEPGSEPREVAGMGCTAESVIAAHLHDAPVGGWSGGGTKDGNLVFQGFARDDVERVLVGVGAGPVEAHLSEIWRPDGPSDTPIRAFVAVLSLEAVEQADAHGPQAIPRVVEVTLADGSVVDLRAGGATRPSGAARRP